MQWNLAFTAILALFNNYGTVIKSGEEIAHWITILETLLPVAIQYAKDEVQVIKGMIGTLSASNAASPDQMAQLVALKKAADDAFDAADADATVADAADDAAAGKP